MSSERVAVLVFYRFGMDVKFLLLRRITVGGRPVWEVPELVLQPGATVEESAIQAARVGLGLQTLQILADLGDGPCTTLTPRGKPAAKSAHWQLVETLTGSPIVLDRELGAVEAKWLPHREARKQVADDEQFVAILDRAFEALVPEMFPEERPRL
jgi:hypothetical protein